jgi:type II secretory pathway predicted ATPase ExeA
MIRSWFGLHKTPFAQEDVEPLRQQREILDVLLVHCQQGGLSVVQGEPGVGKSVIKEALVRHDPKRLIVPVVGRTLHTYNNTLRILCQAFGIEQDGGAEKCEQRLILQAQRLNQQHKMLAPIIDDAHLLDIQCLRKLRLMLEEFPKNHNLILLGQTELLRQIGLSVNEDIRGRITFSATLLKLAPDDLRQFVLERLERAGLGHNTLTEEALALIVRSSEGVLRRVRNLCLGALIEAVRDQTKTVDIKQVNAVLRQPHWRRDHDLAQT